MRKQFIYLLFLLFFTTSVQAQYLQLVENKGEFGVFAGQASYNGDIAPNLQFLTTNFGGFYKRQLNDYVGLRLNYEIVPLGAFDSLTANTMNSYVRGRSLYFKTTYQDISLMTELYFLKFINGNKNYRFSPYLGFGVGYLSPLKDTSTPLRDSSNYKILGASTKAPNIITMPLTIGFKYNVVGSFNVFGEFTYRFTNSDQLDHFGDNNIYPKGGINYQASTSGKDQFFSAKLGLSYNFLRIYGPDPRPKAKRDNLFSKTSKSSNKGTKKSLFGFFKRK
jgi:outer membrane protein W